MKIPPKTEGDSNEMSAAVPTAEPRSFVQGDSISFTKSLSDYSAADGWSLTYAFRGNNLSYLNATSTASGSDHLISISTADSESLVPGDYSVAGYAIKTGERVEIWRGTITVKPDLLSVQEGQDIRTSARRTLDNLNAVIEKRATHDILNSQIEGTRIERMTPEQLILLRDRYAEIVAAEENSGSGRSRVILTQFTRPR